MEPHNKSKQITITSKDLPLCCPQNAQAAWNYHPKVYLPINKEGMALCPYCSTTYLLE